MPDPIDGTHLQLCKLDYRDIVPKLDDFGEWTSKLEVNQDFVPITTEVHRCTHSEREQRIKPILDALGYTGQVCDADGIEKSVEFIILRVLSRSHFDARLPANLIPVRIQKAAARSYETPARSDEAVVRSDEITAGRTAAAGNERAAAGRTSAPGSRPITPGTIYDSSMNPVHLAVGHKIHIKRPVIVDPGMDFVLLRLGPQGTTVSSGHS
jgi:hypothetical protein